ncbi:endonuclease [Massilia sp. CMS3.1]|uniref:endonuclease n=1 Tax=Massilia sp. CMS3.1 TaxID=3373083 RepID=UPI003F4C3F52
MASKFCIRLLVATRLFLLAFVSPRTAGPVTGGLPSIKEETPRFVGQQIVEAGGNTTMIDPTRLLGQNIVSLRTWGKHFLIELPDMAIRIHFLLFGTYRVNEQREGKPPRPYLRTAQGDELNLYACSVREIDAPAGPGHLLGRRQRHQERSAVPDSRASASTVGALPAPKPRALVEEARQYSFDFLAWKKQWVLKKNWLAHAKKICPRRDIPFTKAHLSRSNRRSFFCERCQKRYA